MPHPYILGLTGGIASGKSTVSHWLSQHNIEIIDADLISREIVLPDTLTWKKIHENFKSKFNLSVLNPDKSLNRSLIKKIIFEHPEERLWLESLTHPIIREKINHQIKKSKNPIICLVIPLLKSREDYPMIQTLITIDIEPPVQLDRLIKRDPISPEQAKKIMASQPSREARLAMADIIIPNHDGLEQLENYFKIHVMPNLKNI